MQAGERLLGDEHPVAHDLVVGQLERGVEHGLQRLREVLVLGDDAIELLAVGLDGERLDLVQAMELGLEVVVQRRRADADRLGDVSPLAVLVPLLTEQSIAVVRMSSRLLRENEVAVRSDGAVRREGRPRELVS